MFIDPFRHDGDPVQRIQAPGFEIELAQKRLTELVVSSGQLVACDPIAAPESEPFALDVPCGKFPVYVLFAHMREEKRPAFISVEFNKQRATKWSVANVTSEDVALWNDPAKGGFQVETGVGALVDVVGADLVLDTIASAEGEDEYVRTLQGRLARTKRGNGMAWAEMTFGLRDGTNLVAFEAPDGVYSTYVGRTSAGDLARVVVDLNVLDFQFTPYGIRLPARSA